jgi:hypothetical protein
MKIVFACVKWIKMEANTDEDLLISVGNVGLRGENRKTSLQGVKDSHLAHAFSQNSRFQITPDKT